VIGESRSGNHWLSPTTYMIRHRYTRPVIDIMPPRPFPSSLRVGVDICKIERMTGIVQPKHLKKDHSAQFLKKLFTPRELLYFRTLFVSPQMHSVGAKARIGNYIAGRCVRLRLHDQWMQQYSNASGEDCDCEMYRYKS